MRASRSTVGVEQTTQAGDVRVTLRVDNTVIGERVIDVLMRDVAGKPVDSGSVRLRFTMIDMDMGNVEVSVPRVGPGHFQARGQFFSMAGAWTVEASLLRWSSAARRAIHDCYGGTWRGQRADQPGCQVNAQTILAGQKLYIANYVPCHGASGKGDGPAGVGLNPRPDDFTQHMTLGKHADGQVFLWIKNGYPQSAITGLGPALH